MFREFARVVAVADGKLRVVEEMDELQADLLLGVSGKDAAVHIGLRALGQRVQ